SALANLVPGHQDAYVNYHNDERAPLLFVAGTEDNIMPPKVQWSNAKHYKSDNTLTEVAEFSGKAHLLPAQEGWENIADYALAWAVRHAKVAAPVG
nr:alpha/beta hydrolase [Micromonospora sp. DSM 115978]